MDRNEPTSDLSDLNLGRARQSQIDVKVVVETLFHLATQLRLHQSAGTAKNPVHGCGTCRRSPHRLRQGCPDAQRCTSNGRMSCAGKDLLGDVIRFVLERIARASNEERGIFPASLFRLAFGAPAIQARRYTIELIKIR